MPPPHIEMGLTGMLALPGMAHGRVPLTRRGPVRSVRAVLLRGKFVVVMLVVLATGGQWFLLQSVAWLQMTVQYAQTDPLGTALQKTFDGKHPCALCKLVKRARAAEREREPLLSQIKLDFHLAAALGGLVPPRPIRPATPFVPGAIERQDAPALPPPRAAMLAA